MGSCQQPQFVTPLVAFLFTREKDYLESLILLEDQLLGPRELESPLYPFNFTRYYEPTMGAGLQRRLVTFQRLADPGLLADWKLAANQLEAQLARTRGDPGLPQRPVNLDPGYLTGAKLVLASTKDFAHRIYLRAGIYAEITLNYRRQAWQAHPCTFPDFASPTYHPFLDQARDRHLRKTKGLQCPETSLEG